MHEREILIEALKAIAESQYRGRFLDKHGRPTRKSWEVDTDVARRALELVGEPFEVHPMHIEAMAPTPYLAMESIRCGDALVFDNQEPGFRLCLPGENLVLRATRDYRKGEEIKVSVSVSGGFVEGHVEDWCTRPL